MSVWGLARAMHRRQRGRGEIDLNMQSGVMVLFNEFVKKFRGDVRFASDEEEAAGLLVDACRNVVEIILRQTEEEARGVAE